MQINGLSYTSVEVEPLDVANSLLKDFLNLDCHFYTLISWDIRKVNNKYFIFENRRYFDNSSEEIINRELTLEEYEYYLALKIIINYLEKQKELKY